MTIEDLPFPVDDALQFRVWKAAAVRRYCLGSRDIFSGHWKLHVWPSVAVREPLSVVTDAGHAVVYRDGRWTTEKSQVGAHSPAEACCRWEKYDAHERTYPKLLALRDAAPVTRPLTDEEAKCIVEDITAKTGVEL